VSSPANRALSTANMIAVEIGFKADKILLEKKIYDASLQQLIDVVHELDDAHNNVMIFGHNPGFTLLANYLCPCGILNIPTCGIVAVSFDVKSWEEIKPMSGKLIFFDFPKNESD
jgi:phosphohistidine phosphatase